MPKVSIITTFYNAELTIQSAVDSVLSQTHKDFDYILVDDGSDDSSIKILKRLEDHRITIMTPGRIGRAKALNLALDNAKGEYICILDADDIACKTRIERQLETFEKNTEAALVFSNAFLMDDNSNVYGKTNFPLNHQSMLSFLLKLNPFPHSSVMFRREAVLEFGGYNERCEKSLDFNLYIELILHSKKFLSISEPLIKLRVSANSWGKDDDSAKQVFYGMLGLANLYIFKKTSKNLMRSSNMEWEMLKSSFSKWFELRGFKNKSNAKKHLYKSRQAFRKGNIRTSLREISKAFIYDPLFFSYRGVNFSFDDDLNEFMTFFKADQKNY